jgi:hypothetical protein
MKILKRMFSRKQKTEKIDNPKKFQNEFESFKDKLGKHSVWFYALDNKRQWDLLFLWKQHKFLCKKGGVEPSLRKFLWEKRKRGRFFVSKQKIRESALNQIIQ